MTDNAFLGWIDYWQILKLNTVCVSLKLWPETKGSSIPKDSHSECILGKKFWTFCRGRISTVEWDIEIMDEIKSAKCFLMVALWERWWHFSHQLVFFAPASASSNHHHFLISSALITPPVHPIMTQGEFSSFSFPFQHCKCSCTVYIVQHHTSLHCAPTCH